MPKDSTYSTGRSVLCQVLADIRVTKNVGVKGLFTEVEKKGGNEKRKQQSVYESKKRMKQYRCSLVARSQFVAIFRARFFLDSLSASTPFNSTSTTHTHTRVQKCK